MGITIVRSGLALNNVITIDTIAHVTPSASARKGRHNVGAKSVGMTVVRGTCALADLAARKAIALEAEFASASE